MAVAKMQEYPVRRGHVKKTDLPQLMRECFGTCAENDDWLTASFGAMPNIRARYQGLTKLEVDTQTSAASDPDAAQETIKAWNRFLQGATGYNSKQRSKKLQAAAKKAP